MKNHLKPGSVIFLLLNFLLYVLYGLLVGIALIPSVFLVGLISLIPSPAFFLRLLFLALGLGVAIYLFFIWGLLVFGVAERLLSLGFRPGKYSKDSAIFLRWIVYSGVHTISLGLILPFVLGSGFAQIYYKIIGCKLGKNVFINTIGLHDAYLLTLGDNVVIGGKADITCHIFEGETLILGNVKIGDNVIIGANSYVQPNTTIEDRCSIGPNSLVRKGQKVASSTVLMTTPALSIREVSRLLKLASKKGDSDSPRK